jgi:hypothetical protein
MSTVVTDKIFPRFNDYVDLGVHQRMKGYISYTQVGTHAVLDGNSLNISSIVDSGTGISDITFSNSFDNNYYQMGTFVRGDATNADTRMTFTSASTKTSSEVRIYTEDAGANEVDSSHACCTFYGNITL